MDKVADNILLMFFGVVALIVLMAIGIETVNVDGEHYYEAQACEPLSAEEVVPEAIEKEVIADIPKYTTLYVWTPDEPVVCEEDEEIWPTRDEVYCLARTVHGEASICSKLVKSQVAWCILNRVSSEGFPDTIREVVTADKQFQGYYRDCDTPYTVEEWEMCYAIIKAWRNCDDRYRSLPSNYLYMRGDGETNYFTTRFSTSLREAKSIAYKGGMPNFWEGEEQ